MASPRSGPPCGNNSHTRLTPGDRAAVEKFTAYLASRPRCADCGHRPHDGAMCQVVDGRDECGCGEGER